VSQRYSLPHSVRERLLPEIDPARLERLLAALPSSARELVIRCCVSYPDRAAVLAAFPELAGHGQRALIIPSINDLVFEDKHLQPLLEDLINARARNLRFPGMG